MNKILQVQNLSYSADKTIIPIIKTERINIFSNISFDIYENEVVGIAGESGSGKTTLAKLICGLLQKDAGKIIFNFSNVKKGKTNPVQILFQNNGEIINPLRKIDDISDEALKLGKIAEEKLEEEKDKILESIGIPPELLDRKGYELSGGQQQRIALARLLTVKPKILILDEPFSSQDIESQINFVELFKQLKTLFGMTIICISHNLAALKNLCDRILIMHKGKIIEGNFTAEIFRNPQNNYTKFLLKACGYNLQPEDFKL
jgi:ABC-type dipeptide/oligopeptide/nickel transport system ATPase subunit